MSASQDEQTGFYNKKIVELEGYIQNNTLEIMKLTGESQVHQNNHHNISEQLTTTRSRLDESLQKSEQLENERDKLTRDLNDTQEQLESTKSALSNLEKVNATAQQAVTDLTDTTQQQHLKIKDMQTEISGLQTDIQTLRSTLETKEVFNYNCYFLIIILETTC
jgi:chromosome segregation ATPase